MKTKLLLVAVLSVFLASCGSTNKDNTNTWTANTWTVQTNTNTSSVETTKSSEKTETITLTWTLDSNSVKADGGTIKIDASTGSTDSSVKTDENSKSSTTTGSLNCLLITSTHSSTAY